MGLKRFERLMGLVLLTLTAMTAVWAAGGPYGLCTPYVRLGGHGGTIDSLQFDGTGRGSWGAETLALAGLRLVRVDPDGTRTPLGGTAAPWRRTPDGAGLSITGLSENCELRIMARGPELRITPVLLPGVDVEWEWSLRFIRDGFYDVDSHTFYPDARSVARGRSLVLPCRKFVAATGHTRFIEEFLRANEMNYWWLGPTGRFLVCGDATESWDLDVTWPGPESRWWRLEPHALVLTGPATPLTIRVQPRGYETVPGRTFIFPAMAWDPDGTVTSPLTGKNTSLNGLLADFLQQGCFFSPAIILGGDWVYGGVETHLFDDDRSPYKQAIRRKLLEEAALVGYDRYGRFGYRFCWGASPNYGDPAIYPDHDKRDVRHLHSGSAYVVEVARYALATGDRELLLSRRERFVATDGAEAQPLCGRGADAADSLLVKGDARLDGLPPTRHRLGQTFTASAPFRALRLMLGNLGRDDTTAVIALKPTPDGASIETWELPFAAATAVREVPLSLDGEMPAGRYFLEVADARSGQWAASRLVWLTNPCAPYSAEEAWSGPFTGTLYDLLRALVEYTYERFGPALHGVCAYDPSYGYTADRSGRPGGSSNSFWEGLGGGKDAYATLFYASACEAMSELARLVDDTANAQYWSQRWRETQQAFGREFWHVADDNGRRVGRFQACTDWDGNAHDYGFSYVNLEAIARGLATREQAHEILWWLDRGQYSPDGQTWLPDIYSVWTLAPPFNTIANYDWVPYGGTLPYMQVLTNGGTRPVIAAVDLQARLRTLGADNAYERDCQVLARYASPDRLTGGRIVAEPGGRGRWHFGPPDTDLADVEGFREVFPQEGLLAATHLWAYLGLELTAHGLRIRPRLPSAHTALQVTGLGYQGALLDIRAEAQRTPVLEETATGKALLRTRLVRVFRASEGFNRVGVTVRREPPTGNGRTGLTLILQQRTSGGWEDLRRTWLSHLADGQRLWITVEGDASPGEYRLVASDPLLDSPGTLSLAVTARGALALRLERERLEYMVTVGGSPRVTGSLPPGGSTLIPPEALR